MKVQEYQEPITIEYENCKAIIRRPVLTEEERKRRMKALTKAATQVLLAEEKCKEKLAQAN